MSLSGVTTGGKYGGTRENFRYKIENLATQKTYVSQNLKFCVVKSEIPRFKIGNSASDG